MSLLINGLPIEKLTTDQRLDALAQIWDSLLADDPLPPISEEQRAEVRRRVALADADPGAGVSLEQFRQRLLRKS